MSVNESAIHILIRQSCERRASKFLKNYDNNDGEHNNIRNRVVVCSRDSRKTENRSR